VISEPQGSAAYAVVHWPESFPFAIAERYVAMPPKFTIVARERPVYYEAICRLQFISLGYSREQRKIFIDNTSVAVVPSFTLFILAEPSNNNRR
jgi:hypothetical protein